ncbi:LamG-like jellyroll fold domain-containing protein [uncultured Winogradskyella sp.]|uniref:LamG-like jellyroll fold domain-containing protein n=1 Tax=uncultured Winogradskyella sp. TaxID=395353 RepID=UPI00262420F7|nr:LamG-like jellyroll fold domain-containing protein [uncultured Winogradskyella sp.]
MADRNENLDTSCDFTIPDYTTLTTANDNCATLTVTQSPIAGTVISGAGTVQTITLSTNDGSNPVVSTMFDVTLIDNIAPTLSTVVDRNENLDTSCDFTIPDYTALTIANDNCATLTVTQSPVAGTVISGAGTVQTITLFTNDGSNPVVSTTFDVTLIDNIAPTLTAVADRNENLDASCDFTIPDYTSLTTANDNCATLTVTQSPIAGTVISGAGTVQTITLSTNDGSNPVVSTMFDVTLIDNIAPTAICKDLTITLNASGNASITVNDLNNGSSDACSAVTFNASQLNFDCSDVGTNNVILTVYDLAGNSSVCSSTVTVIDPAENASVSLTVDNNPICSGENSIFTATPTNGGASPIYEWFINGVSFGTSGSNTFAPFTPLNDADEVYVQIQSNLSSCIFPKQSNSITMSVRPLPIVTGASSLCVESTTTLTPSTSGWVSNTAFATVDNSGIVTGVSAGNATFTYTDSNGCSSDITISVNALPVVTSPTAICVSETSTLSPSTGGTWVSNNTTRAAVTSTGIITGIAPGFVTFTYTDSRGCSTTTSPVEILLKPIITSVTASDNPICSGESSILTASVQGAGTNNDVIVNYNFNTGSSFATLDGQEVPGITSNVSHVNMYYRTGAGTPTQGSAYIPEGIAGNSLRQQDNQFGNSGYWRFTLGGANISTYQNFSLYFQTKRATEVGDDKYVSIYYRVNGTGNIVLIDKVLINNTLSATQWEEIIYSIPALADNPNQLEIIIAANDGYRGTDFSQNPDISIDNVQVRASNVPDTFTYSWTGNTGVNAGLPVGADIPSSANSSITVNPETSTQYTVTAHNSNGCTETENITITVNPSPKIVIAAEYCPTDILSTPEDESNMVQLVATDLNDSSPSSTTWEWQTTPVQYGDTIYVNSADFYQVIGTSTNGCTESGTIRVAQELIFNGDFSNAASTTDGDFGPDVIDNLNAIGFDYDEDYTNPYDNGYRYFANPIILDDNHITITTDSGPLNSNFRSVADHTSDTDAQFLAVNGSNATFAAWRQEIEVEPGELYYFSAWGIDLSDPSNASLNPCDLRFRINGTEVGPTLDLVTGNSDWERIYGTWNSGANTTAILEIVNINSAAQGNNFGIDDVSFATLSTFITLTSIAGTDNQTICQNTPIQDITYDVGGGLNAPSITGLPAGLSTTYDGLKFTITGTPTVFGTYTYTLSTTSSCDVKSESGTITIDEAPVVAIQNIVSPICSADGSIAVNATLSGSASSGAWTTSGTGTFSPSANSASATYNFGFGEVGVTTLTFTSNTPLTTCAAATDSKDFTIVESIIADAGTDIDNSLSDCSNTTVILAANNVIGVWSVTSGQPANSYNFSDSSAYNSTFTGESGETYTLQWQAANTTPCSDTSDTMTIIFADCGSSLVFDGTEDYINFDNNYGLENNSFSIESWIKVDNIFGTKTILSKRDSGTLSSGYDLGVFNNRIRFKWNNQVLQVNQPINFNQWYHIAVTFNGVNTYTIYVNGFNVQSTSAGNSPLPNTNKSIIGAMDTSNGNPTHYFDGAIDEVRIWNTALSETQIREMMNQEIEADGPNVKGVEIPLDISGGLQWNNLIGYYQMGTGSQSVVANGYIEDISTTSATQGKLNNMTTIQAETAPIPYVSGSNNVWDNQATWINGSVQQIPNSRVNSHSGAEQTWNIVRTTTDVLATRPTNILSKTTVLGLIVDSNRLSILGDQQIIVDKYLKIDGILDLVDESQLLQPEGSILEPTSTGYLERDQQGSNNGYNYNYWGSPVKTAATTFTLSNILYDGADGTTPVNWITSYDGIASPLSLSTRWLYIFNNGEFEDYTAWNQVSQNAALNVGLGFLMKGSNTASPTQNYTFRGLPNNGTITNFISGGTRSSLVGNPYPSAIDANAFIDDNASALLDGTLIFWEQSPNSTSHNLAQYEGRYSYYNKTGGLPSTIPVEINGQGTASNTPERYVPIAQGFFVNGSSTGGNITFNNGQRIFKTEASGESVFLRSPNSNTNQQSVNGNAIKRLRMSFKTPEGAKRHLLLGFTSDNSATDSIDYGYDGLNSDNFPSDMSFIIEGNKYVIQGVGAFDVAKTYPLDLTLAIQGNIEIQLESLENFNASIDVYIYDALLGTYSRFNENNFQLNLEAGNYTDRFYLVFQEDTLLSTIKEEREKISVKYLLDSDEIFVSTPQSIDVKQLYLINVAGQTVASWNATNITLSHEIRIPVKNISEGTYILKVETESNTLNKKIIIH